MDKQLITIDWLKNHPERNNIMPEYAIKTLATFGFDDCPGISLSKEEQIKEQETYNKLVEELKGKTFIEGCEELWPDNKEIQFGLLLFELYPNKYKLSNEF